MGAGAYGAALQILGAGVAAIGAGRKPKLPPFPKVDIGVETKKTAQANLGVLPDAEKLSGQTNAFNADQLSKMLAGLPGYNEMQGKSGSVIQSLLGGELPADLSRAVWDSANSKSVAGGFGGTGMARNLRLRDLGLTSLGLMTQGLSAADRWLSRTRMNVPDLFTPQHSFVDPGTAVNLAFQNNLAAYQAERDRIVTDAGPNPKLMAAAQALSGAGGLMSGGSFGKMGG